MILSPQDTFRLLKKLPTSQIAELSNLSNAYISQVKHGRRPPSVRLIEALDTLDRSKPDVDYIGLFLKSRSQGLSPNTIEFYRRILANNVKIAQPSIAPSRINTHLKSINGSLGNKHAHFRAFRAFFHWLYSPKSGMGLNPQDNPMLYVEAPKVPKLILPSLTREQVESLITKTNNLRDKAIIALFTESGLRLSELANMKLGDVDWQNRIIKTLGKGGKEAYAPFGSLSERYLKAWLNEHQPKANESIWGH